MSPSTVPTATPNGPEREQDEQQNQEHQRRRPKRRRIGYACDQCRFKKNRCDSERPSCGPCEQRRIKCVYSAQKALATFPQDYVDDLKARNIILERQLAAQTQLLQNNFPSPVQSDARSSPALQTQFSSSETQHPTQAVSTSRSYPQFATSLPQNISTQISNGGHTRSLSAAESEKPIPRSGSPRRCPDENIECEGNGSQAPMVILGEVANSCMLQKPSEYFGESSTFDFMTKVCSPGDTTKCLSDTIQKQSPSSVDASIAISSPAAIMYSGIGATRVNDDEFGLPRRVVADKLVDAYFTYRHPLNPYLHEPSFRQQYEKLWLSEEFGGETAAEDNVGWFGLLNIVFCFGCDHAKLVGKVPIDRTRFFKRAKTLVFSDLLQPSRIELVQALLLMGQYLHRSLDLNACWTVVGLAIRMAQGLGLHLDPNDFTTEIVEQEVRKRVWWGCFVMDRILSMKVGRPPTIHDDDNIKVGVPIIIDDKYLTSDKTNLSVQPSEIPSKLDFFLQVISLCRLIDRIRDSLYNKSRVDLSRQKLTDVPRMLSLSIELDGDLVAWQKKLPPHLRPGSQLPEWHFEHQRSTLFIRFQNARLLLHRQILLIYVTCVVKDDFQCEVMHGSIRRCIIAAYAAVCEVRLLHKNRFFHYWRHHSHCIFAALGVMLAFKTLDKQKKEEVGLPDSIDVDQAISDGKRLLEEVSSHLHPLAAHYLQSYQRLEARLQKMASEREYEASVASHPQTNILGKDISAQLVDLTGEKIYSPNDEANTIYYRPTDEFAMLLDSDFTEFENIVNGGAWPGFINDCNEA